MHFKFSFLLSLGLSSFLVLANSAKAEAAVAESTVPNLAMTKTEAYSLLKKNGLRWQQTELLVQDALTMRAEADALTSLHLGLLGAEYVSRGDLTKFGITPTNGLDVVSFGATTVEFELSLFNRKASSQQTASSTNVALSNENRKQYQSELTGLMVLAYLTAQRVAEKLHSAQDAVQRDGEIVKMAEAKIKSGTGIGMDVMRAKALLNADKVRELDNSTNLKKALKDLASLLGVSHIDKPLEPLTLHVISVDSADPFVKTGIDDRPDVKAAVLTLQVAGELQVAAGSEFLPQVRLFGSAGVAGSNLFPSAAAAPIGSVGLQIHMPLYDGGFYSAKEEQASVNVRKAELQGKQIRLDADDQIAEALEQLKTSHAAATLASEQVDLATQELAVARRRFVTGATSGADLASSQNNLALALNGRVDVVFAYEASKLNYFKSIGEIEKYFDVEARQ